MHYLLFQIPLARVLAKGRDTPDNLFVDPKVPVTFGTICFMVKS